MSRCFVGSVYRVSLLLSLYSFLILIDARIGERDLLSVVVAADQSQSVEIQYSGAIIEVQFLDGVPQIGKAALLDWVKRCVKAVCSYFGQMPVKKLRIKIQNSIGNDIGFSTTGVERGVAEIEVPLGSEISQKTLNEDWVLTHEMVHLAFPIVAWKDRWLTEGMATYIEPLARMKIGSITEKEVWGDLIRNTAKGLPRSENDPLIGARRIDRIYWGGAIFCLIADVEIRKKSNNRVGLQDVLSYIPKSGVNIYSDDEPRNALSRAERSDELKIATQLLLKLYDQYNSSPILKPNLAELFASLGVSRSGGEIIFNENAPLAGIRRAIDKGASN